MIPQKIQEVYLRKANNIKYSDKSQERNGSIIFINVYIKRVCNYLIAGATM